MVDLIIFQEASSHDVIDTRPSILFSNSSLKLNISARLMPRSQLFHSPLRPTLCWAIECCQEKGASSWLSTLPIKQYGFALHKTEFIDAHCLHYGWIPSLTVSVAKPLLFLMFSAALTVVFPSSAKMTFTT